MKIFYLHAEAVKVPSNYLLTDEEDTSLHSIFHRAL